MAETNLKLRSPNFESFKVTAPSAGYTAGQMVKIEDTVCVIVETAAAAASVAAIFKAEAIVVPKATGVTFAVGDKVYFDASAAKITSVSSGNTLCGRAKAVGASGDTTLEIALTGNVAA